MKFPISDDLALAEHKTLSIKYRAKLKILAENPDEEAAHIQADDVLCDILNQLGFEDVVEEYRKIPKWYA